LHYKIFSVNLSFGVQSELNEVYQKEKNKKKMVFAKRWQTKWELKSLTQDELFNVIVEVVTKQLDEIEKDEVVLGANLVIDYEADSVDVVAMLLYLEDMFKNASQTTRTVVPTDKLGQIVLVEDILDIIYEVLLGIETKMETFIPIKPDFAALEKRQKMGELYPKD
jgi:acyl carrier protein